MFFPVHDQNNKPVKIIPVVTYGIIFLCTIVYLYQYMLQIGDPTLKTYVHFLYTHAMVPRAYLSGLTEYQFTLPVVISSSHLWLHLMPITALFLHANLMHLVGNMWFFWIFADNVEERLGSPLFFLFYILTGTAASLGYLLYRGGNTMMPLIGASGAVFSVMGAYMILFPSNRITTYVCPIWFFVRRIDVSALIVTGMLFFTNVLSITEVTFKLAKSAVSFEAHIVGFISGLLCGWLFKILATSD